MTMDAHVTRVFYGPSEKMDGPFVAVVLSHYKERTEFLAEKATGCATLSDAQSAAMAFANKYGCAATLAVIH
jgi:hypothetical protein